MKEIKTRVKISDLFLSHGINYKDMLENETLDVSDKNIYVKTYNEKTKKNEQKKVLSFIRKNDTVVYSIIDSKGTIIFKASPEHKVMYMNEWKSLQYLYENKFPIISENNEEYQIIKTEEIHPILDIEVEGNHNYYANGVLSHNTTTGGNGLKFYASIRCDIRRAEVLDGVDKDDDVLGIKTRIKCIKNKTAQPFRKAEIDINFENGIDVFKEYVDFAVMFKYIDKAGAWYSFKKHDGTIEKLGQGKENVSKYLLENKEIFDEIKKKVDAELRIDTTGMIENGQIKEADVLDKKEKRKYTKKEEETITLE